MPLAPSTASRFDFGQVCPTRLDTPASKPLGMGQAPKRLFRLCKRGSGISINIVINDHCFIHSFLADPLKMLCFDVRLARLLAEPLPIFKEHLLSWSLAMFERRVFTRCFFIFSVDGRTTRLHGCDIWANC